MALNEFGLEYKKYTWLDRGSDERQYCSPNVDLPVSSIMRSKYGNYSQYHTSADDLDFISENGLEGAFDVIRGAIEIADTNEIFNSTFCGEAQLSKYNLYPKLGGQYNDGYQDVFALRNVLSFMDGNNDLIEIAKKCNLSYRQTLAIAATLKNANVIFPQETSHC
jgi:aminopeptidase-like protein